MPQYKWVLESEEVGFKQIEQTASTVEGDYAIKGGNSDYGTLYLTSWPTIFEKGHRIYNFGFQESNALKGYYDSKFDKGLPCYVLMLPAAIFLHSNLIDKEYTLPIQIDYRSGTWQWRLLKQSPHLAGRNLLRAFMRELTKNLKIKSPYLVFPDLDRLRIKAASFSGCESKELGWVSVDDTSLTLETEGGWLGLGTPSGGCRIRADKLIFNPNSGSPEISVVEGGEPDKSLPIMRITFSIPKDKQSLTISKIEGSNSQSSVSLEPFWVMPSSQHALNLHSDPTNKDPSLWVGGDNGWLHLESPASPPDFVKETRRWDLAAALGGDATSALSIHTLLDQSGSKRLTLTFNARGDVTLLTLEIASPVLEIESSALRVLRGADLACPTLPPGPSLKGEPLRLLATANNTATNSGAVQFKTNDENKVELKVTSQAESATLWTRPANPLIGPMDWAANDPHANKAVSTLRTLIPFRVSCNIKLHDETPERLVEITGSDQAAFPNWAVGQLLLPLIPEQAQEQRLEWRITSTIEVTEFIRHANPHQDAGLRWAVPPTKAAEQPAPVPLEWTRVKDAYYTTNGEREFTANTLLLTGNLLAHFQLPENYDETVNASNFSIDIEVKEGRLFRRIRLIKEGQIYRSSVVLQQWLQQRLRALNLAWLPLGYGDDDYTPFQIVALEQEDNSDKQMTMHPALDGQVVQVSFKQQDNSIETQGSVALPARWLCQHLFAGLVPNGFVGIESHTISLPKIDSNLSFILGDIIYWFELDGVVFPVKSVDQLCLSFEEGVTPKVELKGSGDSYPLLIRENAEGTIPASFRFKKCHAVAPGLLLEEHFLLKEQPGKTIRQLVFKRDADNQKLTKSTDDKFLTLDVKDYARELSTQAVCQAGVYYVAWAAECQWVRNEIKTDLMDSGLTLGALTRLFLRLERNAQSGALIAKEGMVGWRCPALPGDYKNSGRARATFYAHGDGKWNTVRLSGLWDNQSQNKSIALWRHTFDVDWSQDTNTVSITDPKPCKQQWALVGQGSTNKTYAFQKVKWKSNGVVFIGQVKTWRPTTDLIPDLSIHVRPSLQVTVADAYQVRWALQTDQFDNWIPPITIQEDCPNWNHAFLPPEQMLADEECDWTAVSGNIATTASKDHGELLCPIIKVEEPQQAWNDRSPKIWVFTDREGDEMALPAGLVGTAAGNEANKEKLRQTAEQILAHMAWRKPAILETWTAEGPVWELVDPPTLNIFSSLDYFTKSAEVGLTSSVQRDPNLVPYIPKKLPPLRETTVAKPRITAKTTQSEIPALAADINRGNDLHPSTAVIRRYTPFEVGSAPPLLFPGTAWPYWPEAVKDEATLISALGKTALFMGCPRPGELQGHSVEEILLPPNENSPQHTPLAGWQARAPRSQLKHTITVDSDKDRGVRWWMDMKVPAVAPRTGEQASVAAVAGRPRQLEFNLGEWWAVGWRVSRVNNEVNPQKRLVVCIEANSDFLTDSAAAELQIKDGETSYAFTLDNGNLLLALPVASMDKPLLMRIYAAKSQPKTTWNVSCKVQSDTDQPHGYKKLGLDPDQFENPDNHRLPDDLLVNGKSDGTSLTSNTPYLVGILSPGKLLAYGPWRCEALPYFPDGGNEIQWRAAGLWSGPQAGTVDSVWIMSPDGAEHWGKKL